MTADRPNRKTPWLLLVPIIGALATVFFLAQPRPASKPSDNPPKVPEQTVIAHETSISSGTEFHAGTTAAIRCEVRGVKSLVETVPLPDASVAITLHSQDEKESYVLYEGAVDDTGTTLARVKIPDVKSGSYKMRVKTKSARGEQTLQETVTVKSDPRVLLTTDKPLYQPGQLIRLRALALSAGSLKPIEKSPILFEIEDGKGNKVFKREEQTSTNGIASADFQLASEVNTGDYQIRVKLGDLETRRTVTVKPYVLPKFKSELKTERSFYLPGDKIKATLKTDYVFGKPVGDAKVKVTAQTFDVEFKEFGTWNGKTAPDGTATFEFDVPKSLVGQPLLKGDAFVRLEAAITDSADHSETIGKNCTVSNAPLKVTLIPEGGTLQFDIKNRLFVATLYPDGTPASCEVEVTTPDDKKHTVQTNKLGLGEFSYKSLIRGASNAKVTAKDSSGLSVSQTIKLATDTLTEHVLLRLDKAIYRGGDIMQVNVHSSAAVPSAYLDVIRNGQVLLTDTVSLKDGKGTAKVTLPPDVSGTIEVHLYQMFRSGTIMRDSRVIYVQPANELKIKVDAKAEYRPGEDATIRFEVTDDKGAPRAAALGVIIVDEAVYALQDMQPGLEKVYFTLQQELLKPSVQYDYRPGVGIPEMIRDREFSADQQQAAEVLLTAVKPKAMKKWEVEPARERADKLQPALQVIFQAVWAAALRDGSLVYERGSNGKVRFHDDLLAELKAAKELSAQELTDPLGREFTVAVLEQLEPNFRADTLAVAVTRKTIQSLWWTVHEYCLQRAGSLRNGERWELPEDLLTRMVANRDLTPLNIRDGWGKTIAILPRQDGRGDRNEPLQNYRLVSAGPDGKFSTDDDVNASESEECLRAAGIPAAHSNVFDLKGFRFLETQRFDRVGLRGRVGVVSLQAFNVHYLGISDGWTNAGQAFAENPCASIAPDDLRRIRWLDTFGDLIGNNDRHLGNISFFTDHARYPQLELTPIYDMLPMRFAPDGLIVVERDFAPQPPNARNRDVWQEAAIQALLYWETVAAHPDISRSFRELCHRCRETVQNTITRYSL